MGTVSQACRAAGGRTLGIVPRAIAAGGGEGALDKEVIRENQSTIFVESMHERKTRMADAAEAGFFGLPGGYGTLEEVMEAVTWVQIGMQCKREPGLSVSIL
jgi:hypothetical protein